MPREQGSVFTTKEFWKKRMWMYYIYPVIWAVIMLIRGEFRWQAGKVWAYQYFFLNIHKSFYGIPGAIWLLITALLIILIIFSISTLFNLIKAFLPLCTIFKFYHINVEKSLSTDFSPNF
ncbi:hypothetical protein [Spiroplasma ixodetis]|uniref:hypothetical protein n=1 Tax=Spiroplasma ixodetis TaxID=2141 RepID=UPI002578CBCE|nr:hypothetical protein [Spiroplasma ixodetis]